MKILLISATTFEISSILKKLKRFSSEDNLWGGRIGLNYVDAVVSGVGMTATAFCLGKQLSTKYDLVINAGVAGSFKKNIPLGTVVNVHSDLFSDLGAEDGERFLTLEEMSLKGFGRLSSGNMKERAAKLVANIQKVKGITVNTVHGNTISIKKVVRKFNPEVESMEGAAVLFACSQSKTPCIQLRAISNYVERRNKNNWQLQLAVKNLNQFLSVFLGAI